MLYKRITPIGFVAKDTLFSITETFGVGHSIHRVAIIFRLGGNFGKPGKKGILDPFLNLCSKPGSMNSSLYPPSRYPLIFPYFPYLPLFPLHSIKVKKQSKRYYEYDRKPFG